MTTYVLRHGRTAYSARYLVNGDPAVPVPLDEEGMSTSRAARTTLPTRSAQTWMTSAFPRARQTAAILLDDIAVTPSVNPLLDELHYGDFEGGPFLAYAAWLRCNGPWARPPGARESQREGIRRMLLGVRSALETPAPRIVVAHGLLLSVLRWRLACAPGAAMPLFFPEAPCLVPVAMADDELAGHVASLLEQVDASRRHEPPSPSADAASAETGRPSLLPSTRH
ncbi:histidine phosphatase family protein [Streptomyces aidingensis]|uniref:Probable phosphoglycerate mutase n=1 Tax=Streptomyces aidingensis TaxID=910347 RepID=A0A1I1KLA0_9ACTN|nr:histidine phosphatase family protein [Streptomyces aidingensis]SFC61636.1 probable phosphoglycerate mutase [Streptomyces aidingensis]